MVIASIKELKLKIRCLFCCVPKVNEGASVVADSQTSMVIHMSSPVTLYSDSFGIQVSVDGKKTPIYKNMSFFIIVDKRQRWILHFFKIHPAEVIISISNALYEGSQ